MSYDKGKRVSNGQPLASATFRSLTGRKCRCERHDRKMLIPDAQGHGQGDTRISTAHRTL